jgi:protein-S-isoprenylcysteine O-methyltransferase Ste14
MAKYLIFIAISVVIVVVSRKSLQHPKSHGFYRFFAWEFIAGLFALNIDHWFSNPFAWYQIISWILLFVSLIPLVYGVHSLVSRGKPVKQRDGDDQLLAFEKTSSLVTSGIYRWIRHPLYSSLLFLNWGVYFKYPSPVAIILAAIATLFLFATARADEAECIRFFGTAYQEYMRKSKRFVPYLF